MQRITSTITLYHGVEISWALIETRHPCRDRAKAKDERYPDSDRAPEARHGRRVPHPKVTSTSDQKKLYSWALAWFNLGAPCPFALGRNKIGFGPDSIWVPLAHLNWDAVKLALGLIRQSGSVEKYLIRGNRCRRFFENPSYFWTWKTQPLAFPFNFSTTITLWAELWSKLMLRNNSLTISLWQDSSEMLPQLFLLGCVRINMITMITVLCFKAQFFLRLALVQCSGETT